MRWACCATSCTPSCRGATGGDRLTSTAAPCPRPSTGRNQSLAAACAPPASPSFAATAPPACASCTASSTATATSCWPPARSPRSPTPWPMRSSAAGPGASAVASTRPRARRRGGAAVGPRRTPTCWSSSTGGQARARRPSIRRWTRIRDGGAPVGGTARYRRPRPPSTRRQPQRPQPTSRSVREAATTSRQHRSGVRLRFVGGRTVHLIRQGPHERKRDAGAPPRSDWEPGSGKDDSAPKEARH